MNRFDFFRVLRALPLSGWPALACVIAAVAIPTGVRAAISGVVTGCEFTPYLPFVLLSAILLRWWQAAGVSLASVAILGGIFAGRSVEFLSLPCFVSGGSIFLASSAVMIGVAMLFRHLIEASLHKNETSGVIFSLEDDQVFASWHGHGPPVRLGSKKRVAAMMEDFLAHSNQDSKLPRRFW